MLIKKGDLFSNFDRQDTFFFVALHSDTILIGKSLSERHFRPSSYNGRNYYNPVEYSATRRTSVGNMKG